MKKVKLIILGIFFILPNLVLAAAPNRPMISKIDEENKIIAGLTPHGQQVIVYIDDKFYGLAQINNSDTDTDNFFFSYKNILGEGKHIVTVYTRDESSSLLSEKSESVEFKVEKNIEIKPAISGEAVSEKAAIEENQKTDESLLTEVQNINNDSSSDEKNKKILIWNLSVFIFFLCAVIGWIFWVNKELKKEKQEAEAKENK